MSSIEKILDKNFNGLLLHSSIPFKFIKDFITVVSNPEETNIKNIYLCSEDEIQALDFATSIMHCLKELELIEDYTYSISSCDTPCIYNTYKEEYSWTNITELANENILILCGNKNTLEDIKNHSEDQFYNIFYKELNLSSYTQKEIKNSAIYMFQNLVDNEGYKLEETFYPSLQRYIDTFYDRSNLKNKDFILDLVYRVVQQNKNIFQHKTLNDKSIPFYVERKDTKEVLKDLKDRFRYSACIKEFIEYTNLANELSKLSLINAPASFDAIIKSSNIKNIETFAKLYADLLYSEEYSILPSNRVRFIELNKLIKNNGTLEGEHGLYVITQRDNFITVEELQQINNIISNFKKVYNNRIVWVLSSLSLDQNAKDHIKNLSPNIYQIFDLDEKNEESIRNFYDSYLQQKNISIIESEYPRIYNSLLLSKNMQEANAYLDRIILYYINNERSKITINSSKIKL